jgi:hypothetical protein
VVVAADTFHRQAPSQAAKSGEKKRKETEPAAGESEIELEDSEGSVGDGGANSDGSGASLLSLTFANPHTCCRCKRFLSLNEEGDGA